MREHRLNEVFVDQLCRLPDRIALDELRDLSADHMGPKEFAGLGVEHGLHETFDFAKSNRLAVTDCGKFSDFHLIARLPGPGLSQADRRDLGPAIGATRNVFRFGRMGMNILVAELAGDRFSRSDALMHRLVRKPGRSSDIADRPNTRHVGATKRIGIDMTLCGFDPKRLEPNILAVGENADRNDNVTETLLGNLSIGRLDFGSDTFG